MSYQDPEQTLLRRRELSMKYLIYPIIFILVIYSLAYSQPDKEHAPAGLMGLSPDSPEKGYIYVPFMFPTIQAAINAAKGGETIIVAPGTYEENLHVNKPITIQSADGPDVTIIDGKANGSVVFLNDYGLFTLDGFTIRNGNNPKGAGIYCYGGLELNLVNNIITDNWATIDGGGIHIARDDYYQIRLKRFPLPDKHYFL